MRTAPMSRCSRYPAGGVPVAYEVARALDVPLDLFLAKTRCSEFDAVVHFDETRAVESLERKADWDAGDAPRPSRSLCNHD
jgi:hypothetical protein